MSNGKAPSKVKRPRKKPAAKTELDPLAKALPPEKPPVEQPNYTMTEWHEKEMFECTRCPWSTLNEDEMVRHVAKHLSSTQPSVIRTDTGFVTPTGAKIIRENIVEEE
jgi:hypothetical protein